MQTYNGMPVPRWFNPSLIISAFENEIDEEKVEEYTTEMREKLLSNDFPPIEGFPHEIDENDIGEYFLSGEEIEEEHVGKIAWKVTDGHHRSLAAIAANLRSIETTLDYNAITNETDLKNFKN